MVRASSRASLRFGLFGNSISDLDSAGSGADDLSIFSGGRRQPGDVTLEESAENLKGEEMLLIGAQGLFERSELPCAPICF